MPDEWTKDYWEALLASQLPHPSQSLTLHIPTPLAGMLADPQLES